MISICTLSPTWQIKYLSVLMNFQLFLFYLLLIYIQRRLLILVYSTYILDIYTYIDILRCFTFEIKSLNIIWRIGGYPLTLNNVLLSTHFYWFISIKAYSLFSQTNGKKNRLIDIPTNGLLVDNVYSKPPGSDLPRKMWTVLNGIYTSQRRCNYLLNR